MSKKTDDEVFTELETLRMLMAENMKEIKDLSKRIDQGITPRKKTVEKTVKKSTKVMNALVTAFWKHRAIFLIVFGVGLGAQHVPEKYRVEAYLLALTPFIMFLMKKARNSLDYVITYNLLIPLIVLYKILAFAINTVTSVAAAVMKLAKKILVDSTKNSS